MKTIGRMLRELRKEKKLTQEEASTKTGINRSTLSNYEIDRRTPNLKELRKLASIYGVGLDYFGITTKDEAFELLARAKKVFASPEISTIEKEVLYQEFLKLYEALKENK